MGFGEETVACRAGFGERVNRGERRVVELEIQAKCLRDRLKNLESLLPENAAVGKENRKENGENPNKNDNSDGCILQILADKEKALREQIYNMECTEESYLKNLKKDDNERSPQNSTNSNNVEWEPKERQINSSVRTNDSGVSSIEKSSVSVKERISRLEACGKNLCKNLRNSRKNRTQLRQEAEILSRELDQTRQELGLGHESAERFNRSYEYFLRKCRETCPGAPEELTDISRTSETGSINNENCPCGSLVKCNSCTVCSCSEWEKDLLEPEVSAVGSGDEGSSKKSREIEGPDEKENKSSISSCSCERYSIRVESICTCSQDFERSTDNETICECDPSDPNFEENFMRSCSCSAHSSEKTILEENDELGKNWTMHKNYCALHGYESRIFTLQREICVSCQSERCRGGVDRDELTKNISPSTECSCKCSLCALRNTEGEMPPCLPQSERKEGEEESFAETEVQDTQDFVPNVNVPLEIQRLCNMEKLRENLERLKNRNHALKKLLGENCDDCSLEAEEHIGGIISKKQEFSERRETIDELIATVKILQSKCRTKDGMIIALAKELKMESDCPERIGRILQNLADPKLGEKACDFDRSTLWKYLEKQSSPRKEKILGKDLPVEQTASSSRLTEIPSEMNSQFARTRNENAVMAAVENRDIMANYNRRIASSEVNFIMTVTFVATIMFLTGVVMTVIEIIIVAMLLIRAVNYHFNLSQVF